MFYSYKTPPWTHSFSVLQKKCVNCDVIYCLDQKLQINFHVLDTSVHSINDVCKFITGSENIPIPGFEKKISVEFFHDCESGCRCLPEASTCSLTLTLPVHIKVFDLMIESLDRARSLKLPYLEKCNFFIYV